MGTTSSIVPAFIIRCLTRLKYRVRSSFCRNLQVWAPCTELQAASEEVAEKHTVITIAAPNHSHIPNCCRVKHHYVLLGYMFLHCHRLDCCAPQLIHVTTLLLCKDSEIFSWSCSKKVHRDWHFITPLLYTSASVAPLWPAHRDSDQETSNACDQRDQDISNACDNCDHGWHK